MGNTSAIPTMQRFAKEMSRELQAGLWHWQAPHPEWTPDQWWPQVVSSYALDDGARLILFDPLAVPEEILDVAADREPVVVLTAPWHERDAQGLSFFLRLFLDLSFGFSTASQ